jgi:hypothetical protein
MNSSNAAGDLCQLIISRVDGAPHDQPPGGIVYTYGAGPNDAILDGREHLTTVLVVSAGQQQWFRVVVEAFDPGTASPLSADHDVLVTLSRRAGVSPPPFRLGRS